MTIAKSLLTLVTVAALMVSCTTTQNAFEGEYDDQMITQRSGNRVYVQDPFYGTVVLERDPFTGRYYDITSGYGRLSSPHSGWNRYRPYAGTVSRGYGNRPVIIQRPTTQRPTVERPQPNREEARRKILGTGN